MKGLIFTFLTTFGGSVYSLSRPFIGLLIYVCFAIIKPDALWSFSVPPGPYSRIIFLSLFVGWAMSGFGNWKFHKARLIVASLCFYLFWLVVCSMTAVIPSLAWDYTEAAAKTILPVLVGMTLIDSVERLRQLAWVIVVSHGYLAFEFNLSYYEGFNTLVRQGFAGMDDKSVAITMVVGASMALFLGLGERRWYLKAVAFACALFMIHVPLFTYSRGGMLALLVSGVMAFILIPKRLVHVGAVVVVILLGFRLAGSEVREKFLTSFASDEERDESAQSRFDLWAQAFETMVEHPFTGVGPRNWGPWARTAYGWGANKEAHNTFVQLGAETGFPGLVTLLAFFFLPMMKLFPLARARIGEPLIETDLARMVVCGMTGFLVSAQFITVYGVEVPYFVSLIGAGLIKLRSDRATVEAPQTIPAPAPPPAAPAWLPKGLSAAGRGSVRRPGAMAR